jgi:prepilin-type N-terminal cleavage/methylation domain-containing protein
MKARQTSGFTLVEMLASVSLLAALLLVLSAVTESASRAWREGQSRTDTFQSARTALELMARELAPAVVDTRMQFVVAPSSTLSNIVANKNATLAGQFATESPALLWMAPLGDNGDLRCVGYYLHRDPARKFYRLKRIFIAPPTNPGDASYFPRMVNLSAARDKTLWTSATDATWFTRSWDADAFDEDNFDPNNPSASKAVVSSAADGVIALWVECRDLLGNPVPLLSKAANHPKSALFYNSAAFFQFATTKPFDNGSSTMYLAQTAQSMKANRVPAAVDLTIVTIDSAQLARGVTIPDQINLYDGTGALDVAASLKAFEDKLAQNKIYTARSFTTRARLNSGS